MQKDIGLIALDLDGTTLNTSKELTPAVHGAIQRALAAGIVVVPNTGRSYTGLPPAVLSIAGVRYAICTNGAEIFDLKQDALLYSDYFDKATALSVLQQCRALGIAPAVMLERRVYADHTDYDRMEGIPQATLEYLKSSRIPVADLAETIQNAAAGVAKFTMVFPRLSLRQRAIDAFTARGDCSVSASFDINLELNTATANKGAGLLKLAAMLGIAQPRTMAMGDGLNDLAMLQAAGYAVAMANGVPQVRAAAHMMAPSCNEDGVAAAINGLFEGP